MRGLGPGFNCWISFDLFFSCMTCWVLIFVLSPFLSWFACSRRWYIDKLWILNANQTSISTSEFRVRLVPLNMFKPSSNLLLIVPRRRFFCRSFWLFMFHVCICCAVMAVSCSLVITCWERAGLLALLCVMVSCVFVTFWYGVLGQVIWYLIESISDLCLLWVKSCFICLLLHICTCGHG